jgi:hypothetical protein
VASSELGAVNRLVDLERPPGEAREQRKHVGDALVLAFALHQFGDRNGACIDHGIEGAVRHLVEHDRVERLSCRFHADMLQHRFPPVMLERVAVHEGLRHRLDGEAYAGIARRVDLAIDRSDGDAEMGRVGLAELGDVVGRLAAGDRCHAGEKLPQIIFDGRGACSARPQASCANQFVQRAPPRASAARGTLGRNCAKSNSRSPAYSPVLGVRRLAETLGSGG